MTKANVAISCSVPSIASKQKHDLDNVGNGRTHIGHPHDQDINAM